MYSACGIKVAATTYLGEFHTNKNRSKYYPFLVSITCMAPVIQSLMAFAIMPLSIEYDFFSIIILKPWRVYILAGNVITALIFVSCLFMPESPKFTMIIGKENETLQTLERIYHFNTGSKVSFFCCMYISSHSLIHYYIILPCYLILFCNIHSQIRVCRAWTIRLNQ